MNDRSNPDQELQYLVETLFTLWDGIRQAFRVLPKPERVGAMNARWVTNPPTRSIVPRLITRAAMQPIAPQERVLIMHSLIAWSEAYSQLVAIAATPRTERQPEAYLEAIEALGRCADDLRKAATARRRDMRRTRGWHRRLRG